jgi:hypothetical protein
MLPEEREPLGWADALVYITIRFIVLHPMANNTPRLGGGIINSTSRRQPFPPAARVNAFLIASGAHMMDMKL